MNVLIADDEYLVRASLKSMLNEMDIGIDVTYEAADGEELVQMVLEKQPDLVYVDIKMPKMNGLQSIKAAKGQCPNTAWIILTGFSVFEYAKEAMDLGVGKYLLKPVSPDELRKSVENVIHDKAERQKKLNFEFSNDVGALLNNFMTIENMQASSVVLKYHFTGAILSFSSCLDENQNVKIQQKLWKLNCGLMQKYINPSIRIANIIMPNGDFAVIFAWNPQDKSVGEKTAESFIEQLGGIAKQISTKNYSETVLYCGECTQFDLLHANLKRLQKLACLNAILPKSELISLDCLNAKYIDSSPRTLKLIEMTAAVSESYKNGSYYEYMKSVEQIEYYFSSKGLGLDALKPFYKFLQYCCPRIDFNSINDLKAVIKALKENGQAKLNINNEPGDLVDQAISFINENYMKDIGIAQIANQLNITPNYLSTLFHKKTGENFMHYLTKTRLLKARELLSATDNPHVNKIAKQVGYYTVNYFTKLYKEYFGVCPSEDTGTRH